jgi:hypothetical protein
MWKAIGAALVMVAATAALVGQTTADGEIAGRISDRQAAPLPGVRVTISTGDEKREAITDSDGRFVVGLVKLGTYQITAELAGFVPVSGTITLSPTTRRAHIVWPLEVGCIEEDIRVILGPREAASLVDAIVHIRVKSDDGSLLWSRRPECAGSVVQSYTVEVLNAVVRRAGAANGRKSLQIFTSPRDVPLKTGEEYLALLWPGLRAEGGLVFPIVSGRVSSLAGNVLSGMRVEDALNTLRKWSGPQQR